MVSLEEKQRVCPRPWGTLDRLPREILFHIMEMVLNGSVEMDTYAPFDVPRIYPNMAHILTRVNSVWFAWGVQFVWERVNMSCFTEVSGPKLRAYSKYVTTLYGGNSALFRESKETFGGFDFPNLKAVKVLRLNDRENDYASIIAAKVNDVKELSIWIDFGWSSHSQHTEERIRKYLSLFPDLENLSVGGHRTACPPKVLDGVLQLTSLTQLELSIQWDDVESFRCLSKVSKLTRLDIHCTPCCWGVEPNYKCTRRRRTLRDVLDIIKPLENLRCFLLRTLERVGIEEVEAFFEGIVREKPKLRELSVQLGQFCSVMPQNFGTSLAKYDSALTRLVVYNHAYDPWVEVGFTRIFPKLKLFSVFKPEIAFEVKEVIGMDFRSVV